jgi:hypothetical protein
VEVIVVLSLSSVFASLNAVMMVQAGLAGIITLTLWITGFLCLLNIALAIIFRQKHLLEVLSYYLVCAIELAIFVFALLVFLGIVSWLPYHLPPGLPINRAQILAALAIGIGLFPAAYWHRVNVSDLPRRIAQDAKAVDERAAAVHVRRSGPGEWMN